MCEILSGNPCHGFFSQIVFQGQHSPPLRVGKRPTQKGSANLPSGSNFPGGDVIHQHRRVGTKPNRETATGKLVKSTLNIFFMWPTGGLFTWDEAIH